MVRLITYYVFRNNKPMIAIDREDCFNKIWDCPILISMPTTEEELKILNDKIAWLKTDEGLKASEGYIFSKWLNDEKEEESK